jgi:hypothetical protein
MIASVVDVVILVAMTFGFVSFTAAIAVEFLGPAPLPWWARSCIPARRGTNAREHVSRALVFIVLATLAALIIAWTLVIAAAGRNFVDAGASTLGLTALVLWLTYLRGRYVRQPR